MGFLGVLFVIILVCAWIGTENILRVLFVAIIIAAVGYFWLCKWSKKNDKENADKAEKLESSYFNVRGHHSQSYSVRPTVTGDFFSYTWETYDDAASNYRYCQYANSTTCANCARRNEHIKEEKYYYGVSNKCKEYNL